MSKVNKHENIIVDYYNNYVEDDRFVRKSRRIEYLTTMRYIKKFAKKGCKILEIGAATGAYSIELAKMGYDVTAVELVESNLNILKKKAKGIKNITCLQGDALDLSKFEDNTFDVVLNLGPMYHLYTQKDKNKAIAETIRICKTNGICMFAYITHSQIVWNYGVKKHKFAELEKMMDKNGAIKDIPKEVFTSYFNEDFNKQFEKTNTTHIVSVAADGLGHLMQDYIDNDMTDDDYNRLLNWHFITCERLDHQGISCHNLYICKKN